MGFYRLHFTHNKLFSFLIDHKSKNFYYFCLLYDGTDGGEMAEGKAADPGHLMPDPDFVD